MAISATIKRLLNNLTPGANTAKLGDVIAAHEVATQPATASVAGVVKQGAAVAAAAGATPTAAEYLALLTSLRNAGVIAPSA